MDSDRIHNLEMTVGHQEGLIAELSGQIYAQDKRVERLEAQVKALTERLKAISPSDASEAPHDARPPHW